MAKHWRQTGGESRRSYHGLKQWYLMGLVTWSMHQAIRQRHLAAGLRFYCNSEESVRQLQLGLQITRAAAGEPNWVVLGKRHGTGGKVEGCQIIYNHRDKSSDGIYTFSPIPNNWFILSNSSTCPYIISQGNHMWVNCICCAEYLKQHVITSRVHWRTKWWRSWQQEITS